MIINDLIVLGRAVPERLSDGRTTICLGGYSPNKGFIRIYPTKANMNINQWAIIEVEVERNERDTREESWKIAGSKNDWDNLQWKIKRIGDLSKNSRLPLVESLQSNCINQLNNAHISLGIIKPNLLAYYFKDNPKFHEPFQDLFPLFQDGIKIKKDFSIQPRVQYRCTNCTAKNHHDQQILEWGIFKWFEKNPDKYEQVWDNLHIADSNYDIYFFVGNQARYRTAYLVISVLRFKKGAGQQLSLFSVQDSIQLQLNNNDSDIFNFDF